MLSRRGLLFGLGATLFVAPAIVNASSLMKINSALVPRGRKYVMDYDEIKRVGFYKDRESGTLLGKWGQSDFYDPLQDGFPKSDYYEAVDSKCGADYARTFQPNWSIVKPDMTKDEFMEVEAFPNKYTQLRQAKFSKDYGDFGPIGTPVTYDDLQKKAWFPFWNKRMETWYKEQGLM